MIAAMTRPHQARTCYALLAVALLLSCSTSRKAGINLAHHEERKVDMPAPETYYPNYQEADDSPEVDAPGVAIRLCPPETGDKYRVGEPIILRGKVGANAKYCARSDGEPLGRTLIKVVRIDEKGEYKAMALDVSPMPPGPGAEDEALKTYLVYSWFNLDLREVIESPDEPGQYAVEAKFLDFASERLEFEIEFGADENGG